MTPELTERALLASKSVTYSHAQAQLVRELVAALAVSEQELERLRAIEQAARAVYENDARNIEPWHELSRALALSPSTPDERTP